MRRRRPAVGSVVQLTLPDGRYAYGRVLRDAAVAFYRETSTEPGQPPIGSRDYQFVVGVYDDVLKDDQVPVVGHDTSRDINDDWPPPMSVVDAISGQVRLYVRGTFQAADDQEAARKFEPAAAWNLNHLVARLMGSEDWAAWIKHP
jgi:hypothetical protein